MRLYPAIDIRQGRCVRLVQGLFDRATVYSDTPADMARRWRLQGAAYLHVVDLDGARTGAGANRAAIRSVVEAVDIPVQLGGGIRTRQTARGLLELGVSRVIIGTKAAERPEFLRELVDEFGPERVAAGVDARDGLVAVEGWERTSCLSAAELCLKVKEYGVRHVIYTDIARDGTLTGPNVAAVKKLTEETGLDIIASGGVSSMEDLQALDEAGIRGVIVGKALYENRVDLREAVRRFER